ncbi:BTB/POZ domain-containing protein DOT3 isoform X1 [Nicotiana tabacum]|uniref:BTB/POZ domain-containing protein DOT3 isoform X1 n=1 Tax=Nicotiana tabacum TaxID=4097 RepID=A0A1S3Y2E4_TOBAC
MQKLIQLDRLENTGDESDGTRQFHDQRIVVPTILNAIADGFEKKEQSWFATSQLPSDLSIRVEDITFYVHKYPLVARCAYLREIEFQPQNSHLGYDLKLEKFPGGSENFEMILKFCYGLPISLNPGNVAALRCGSEFLEMTEAMEEGNLISTTEAFFTFVVLSSWNDSITVLKSCEMLSPWAENLQIVRRCCDSIGWKIFRKNSTEEITNEGTWWFDDIATLRINFFLRIITAIRVKGIKPEIIGSCIMHYGEKWLPNMNSETKGTDKYGNIRNDSQWSITSGRMQEKSIGQNNKEQRIIIESLISILPPQKEAVSCKFLLRLLKMAMLYAASPALISELEKRIGMVFENAGLNDLLIPSYAVSEQTINSTEEQTIYNIDVVQRILDYFLLYEQQKLQQQEMKSSTTVNISKLVDSYLAEIARDHNVSITKFQVLAESLPRHIRTCHDGLYRAIDTYLKTHPSLSEHDRRRLCKIMDSEKLSLDACMHAAQNERLPLRIVIQRILQVLLSEQVKMRAAVQGKDIIASDDYNLDKENNWLSTKKEVKSLKEELEKVKIQMTGLQRDYSELQQEYEKLNNKPRIPWTSGWRKIKKSALFNRKMVEEETQEGENRVKPGRRGSISRRQSIS